VVKTACEVKGVLLKVHQKLLGVTGPLDLLAALARELLVKPKEFKLVSSVSSTSTPRSPSIGLRCQAFGQHQEIKPMMGRIL